jgi:molybdopterin synthase catalytic subunit
MLLFALYRERAGTGSLMVELPQGATVGDAVSKMRELYPQLAPPSVSIVAAVNTDYVDDSRPLHEGDQIALIPPVSGGSS